MKRLAFSLNKADWKEWTTQNNAKPFIAKQILEWIFTKFVTDPDLFSNISKPVREKLKTDFSWELPRIDTLLTSQDTSEKILLKLHDNLITECVIMPSEKRVTLCVSSQVGCKMGCTFCQTGRMGLSRNLESGEILAQILLANQRLMETHPGRKVTNVVFMGMGEPLDNYDEVVAACRVMTQPDLLGMSKNKVTVSTSGLIPEIRRLGQDVAVSLAISLHTTVEEERSAMMPVNRKYPLVELKQCLLEYPIETRHGITFEYVMIHDKNDSIAHAKKLVKFLHGLKAKVNLIPMNPHPGSSMVATDPERMRAFQQYLGERSIPAPVRYSRGQDVSGACGQLAAKRKEELDLVPRKVALARRREYLESKN